MNLLQYWGFIEIGIIVIILSIVIAQLWRKTKQRRKEGKQPLSETLAGKAAYFLQYILRLIGVGVGTLLLLVFVIMIERNMLELYQETSLTPSLVEIPADLGFEVQEITFQSEDGITLAGWFVPSQNDATIILLHGYGGNRTGMIWHARQFVDAGYGVLMYDERASGESGGKYRSYGWEDTRDVKAAIQFLNSHNAGKNIGAMGCSMGADIAVYSTALYPEIGAVWGDGSSSVRAQDLPAPKDPLMALMIAGNYILDWMYMVKLDIKTPEPFIDVAGAIAPRPVMFVGGGTARPFIGSEGELFAVRFAKITGTNAQAWVIPEATHCDGPSVRPDEYSKRMVEFFNSAFGKSK
jgi:uncharacterized protein